MWGTYVRDADTVPVQVARSLHARGYDNVIVYNLGIEGVELANELELLKRFRETYALDQVLFYTGGNDVLRTYYNRVPSANAWTGFISLQLVKAERRLAAKLRPGGPSMGAAERERVHRANQLVDAMAAAFSYCAEQRLACDVMLRPWLVSCAHPVAILGLLRPARRSSRGDRVRPARQGRAQYQGERSVHADRHRQLRRAAARPDELQLLQPPAISREPAFRFWWRNLTAWKRACRTPATSGRR